MTDNLGAENLHQLQISVLPSNGLPSQATGRSRADSPTNSLFTIKSETRAGSDGDSQAVEAAINTEPSICTTCDKMPLGSELNERHRIAIEEGSSRPQTQSSVSDEPVFMDQTEYLATLTREHEHLAGEWEEVATQRIRLRKQRAQLRKIREGTADAEADFMSEIRHLFLHNLPIEPLKLLQHFDALQKARDYLGAIEDTYNEDESAFNGRDWAFHERESNFVSRWNDKPWVVPCDDQTHLAHELDEEPPPVHLPPPPPPPPPPPYSPSRPVPALAPGQHVASVAERYVSKATEADMLRKKLKEIRHQRAAQIENDETACDSKADVENPPGSALEGLEKEYTDLLDDLTRAEVDSRNLRQELITVSAVALDRRASDPNILTSGVLEESERRWDSGARSESALTSLLGEFSSWRSRISLWILDTLRDSPLERARLKAALDRDDLDDDDWWYSVKRNWSSIGVGSANDSLRGPDSADVRLHSSKSSSLTAHQSVQRRPRSFDFTISYA